MVRVCFVCLGNICRSPTAEGVMQNLVASEGLHAAIQVDSAGTGAWHVGERADERSRRAAQKRGIELKSRARQFTPGDFAKFDYVVAMDTDNLANLRHLTADEQDRGKLHLLRDFDTGSPAQSSVPDPYYGGDNGFEEVLDLCEAGCRGLLDHIRQSHQL